MSRLFCSQLAPAITSPLLSSLILILSSSSSTKCSEIISKSDLQSSPFIQSIFRFPTMKHSNTNLSIAVIGGGHYGCVTALHLAEKGYKVTLYEQNSELFRGTSGTFGNRLHTGPHYPRSLTTRIACRSAFQKYTEKFPSLVYNPSLCMFGLGEYDCEGLPARVSTEAFEEVCKECDGFTVLNPEDYGPSGIRRISGLWGVYEPCIYQTRTRPLFTKLLSHQKNVSLVFNHTVKSITEVHNEKNDKKILVDGAAYDWVVNSTYYKSFGKTQVMGAPVFYQVCVALKFEDLQSKIGDPLFMLTIMDGWFPCMEPLVQDPDSHNKEVKHNQYMVYHAKYSILGSYENYADCEKHKRAVTEEWIQDEVMLRVENDMESFMPGFKNRFRYSGYLLNTATKLRTSTEYRGSIVWNEGRIIQQFSGKLTNSILAAEDTLEIIDRTAKNLTETKVCSHPIDEINIDCNGLDSTCDQGIHRWD